MNATIITRDASYSELKNSGGLPTKQEQVFAVINRQQPTTNRETADTLGWPINQVTGRVRELRASGRIIVVGKTLDGETNKTVCQFGTNPVESVVTEKKTNISDYPRPSITDNREYHDGASQQVKLAHDHLDMMLVPRMLEGRTLSLVERIKEI